ncbi:putative DNA methylase [Triangularia verruculosa]|uniref:DNA (cytosine-5-)-methyltransferase n=1 Tax=Triangularia verruculosa TaxID=2587418 RepID=A0AAN6XBJ3_9PEZI|nr:putative DNA methylase [Triangularia verruculosa]
MTKLDSWLPTGQEIGPNELMPQAHDETEAAILDQLRPLLPSTLDFLPLLQGQNENQQLPAVDPLHPPIPSMLLGECLPTLSDAPLVRPVSPRRPEESMLPDLPGPEGVILEMAAAGQTPDILTDTVDILPDQTHSKHQLSVEIPVSTLITPRSQHDGFIPPLPVTKEWMAVKALVDAHGATNEEFIEFDLDQFSFYLDTKRYHLEMRSLQFMDTKNSYDRYYFDGILSCKGQRYYVQRAEVAELPIGNYGTEHPSVDGEIWVRSMLNTKKDIYYRLGKPTTEYKRFYDPFVWATDLAKHVVDFAGSLLGKRQDVTLDVFKVSFSEWLETTHGKSVVFRKWRKQYPSNDFRAAVVNNIVFIWKEMNGIHGAKKAGSMTLFRQTMTLETYQWTEAAPVLPTIKEFTMVTTEDDQKRTVVEVAPTIVTPYIKQVFGDMVISKVLHEVNSLDGGLKIPVPAQDVSELQIKIEGTVPGRRRGTMQFLPLEITDKIQVGDTISTPHDDDEITDTKWKKTGANDDRWFGLVQKVHTAKDGTRSFDVTWLYRPAETPCCLMKYPWRNELFLSDHCTCEERVKVKENEILGVHKVDWFGSPETSGVNFFIRQTYIVEHRRWVSLQESHLRCSHGTEKLDFRTGDTVLVHLNLSDKFTEPCEVVKIFKQGKTIFTRLRRLLRRAQVDASAKDVSPNELVHTDKVVVIKLDRIVGKCHVRCFDAGEPIPSPYNRKGTGNLFYITHRLDDTQGKVVPLDGGFPTALRQGFDPRAYGFRKLRGMDLFCGSGNLGRGLEDGGAVEMHWAADICRRAIHTYMANSPSPDKTHPFFGSVDDLLRLALEGKFADNVPRPGDVEFISAGSPCPGFSLLTHDKKNLKQAKNQSMVASFAAFIDFYRPKYAILENVAAIVQAEHNRTQDTLSQLFCAVVGLGYQAQLVMGDAWTQGAPQTRNRVFLVIAAPGLRLPKAPSPSHSHSPAVKARGIGKLCNGEAYVRRSFAPTPLKYISSSEATADVPDIVDGMVDACISHPDHRLALGYTERVRRQLPVIPIFPYGMNFVKTWNEGKGIMTAGDRELFPAGGEKVGRSRVASNAQGWSRLSPNDPFPTITTQLDPGDARTSGGIHWRESRPLTVLEARRAQGFLDEEVLLGSQVDKMKLVGNSVSRDMAMALGLKLREAWVGGLGDGGKRGGKGECGAGGAVEERKVKKEEWEDRARLIITDVAEAKTVRINGCGKRVFDGDGAVEEGGNCKKIQRRLETRAEDGGVVGETGITIIPAMGLCDDGTGLGSVPNTFPEKEPERTGPTIVRILESDEEV